MTPEDQRQFFLNQFKGDPREAVKFLAQKAEYSIAPNAKELDKQVDASEDPLNTLVDQYVSGKSKMCDNQAALVASVARQSGTPGGLIYTRNAKGNGSGHSLVYYKTPENTIEVASTQPGSKFGVYASYPSLHEMTQSLEEYKSSGNEVLLSNEKGQFFADYSTGKDYILGKEATSKAQEQEMQHEALRDSEGINYLSQ